MSKILTLEKNSFTKASRKRDSSDNKTTRDNKTRDFTTKHLEPPHLTFPGRQPHVNGAPD